VSVGYGQHLPRIVIKSGELCDTLEGAADAYERTPGGKRYYRYVLRFDVQIEWSVAPEFMPQQGWVRRVCAAALRVLNQLRAMGGAA
jgi:hypothetical protein